MSQCHDVYDTVAPSPRRRAVPALTQCHDVYPGFGSGDDDGPAEETEPVRPLEHA